MMIIDDNSGDVGADDKNIDGGEINHNNCYYYCRCCYLE